MKTTLFLTAILAGSSLSLSAQTRFVGEDYTRYFNWHNEQSQIEDLYTPGSKLYVFGQDVTLYRQPDQNSEPLALLQDGQGLYNLSDYRKANHILEGEINGYRDLWFKVSTGKSGVTGYVFGAQLAKGWRWADLTGDQQPELIMLGVSPTPRRAFNDIRAELRILQGNQLLYNTTISGLCVFEECASSPMLRVLRDQPCAGATMIEASTMTVGCYTGIERAFLYWNGRQLENVFHAEYTVDLEYQRHPFKVQGSEPVKTMMCQYKDQDQSFNPVWDCKELKTNAPIAQPVKKSPAAVRAR
ncbi:MAG: hypothetical protein R2824_18740 [Saprospiraceae bacterium]|nr:hypothetical protein [Lewinella sp.]